MYHYFTTSRILMRTSSRDFRLSFEFFAAILSRYEIFFFTISFHLWASLCSGLCNISQNVEMGKLHESLSSNRENINVRIWGSVRFVDIFYESTKALSLLSLSLSLSLSFSLFLSLSFFLFASIYTRARDYYSISCERNQLITSFFYYFYFLITYKVST